MNKRINIDQAAVNPINAAQGNCLCEEDGAYLIVENGKDISDLFHTLEEVYELAEEEKVGKPLLRKITNALDIAEDYYGQIIEQQLEETNN